jgi:ubiquinone biosynthesis protein
MEPRIGRWYLAARLATWAATGAYHLSGSLLRPRARGAALTACLVRLGPTFVKGGQLLSSRADLLSPSWCTALGRLTDRMDAMPGVAARRALAGYSRARDWPFTRLDSVPLASGSIACVYRARLHDGREVAVKVRRPGIARRMAADFRLLEAGAALLERLPGLRGTPMRRMVGQVASAVLGQLDLDREAAILDRLRADLGGLVRVPEPVHAACGDGVLVMEYLEGLGRFDRAAFDPAQRRTIMKNVLRAIYRMLFIDGLVHCDLHPGNLYVRRTGEVVIVDAGFVVELSPRVRRQFAEFFLHMALGHGDDCARVVLDSAVSVAGARDLDGFRRSMRDLIASSHRRPAGLFRLATFANQLFALQRRHRVAAAPEFVFPLLSLLVLEGMILDFDVDVDFQAEAVPPLLKALQITIAEEAR